MKLSLKHVASQKFSIEFDQFRNQIRPNKVDFNTYVSLSFAHHPSPPKRHETWKKARQRKLGDYINEEAHIMGDKIIIRQVTQNITQQFQLQLTSLGLSQQNNVVEPIVNCVSTIGSCIDSYPSRKNNHIDTHKLLYNLRSPIHHKKIEDENVRVVVEEVIDSNAQVPFPTNEVQTIGKASNHFIQWLRKLAKSILTKDLLKVYMGIELLNILVIQLWLLYIHHLCTNKEKIANIYGFMDPQLIQNVKNTTNDLQAHLLNRLHKDKKTGLLSTLQAFCQTQPGIYECGYYFIAHMPKIFTDNIVVSCKYIFGNSGPMLDEDIANIRQCWVTFFLELDNF
ncbi:hypothetical protein JHK85_050877 [Glycine max]|nr:hypothetical protein JHK85_050877 [Glycine max]